MRSDGFSKSRPTRLARRAAAAGPGSAARSRTRASSAAVRSSISRKWRTRHASAFARQLDGEVDLVVGDEQGRGEAQRRGGDGVDDRRRSSSSRPATALASWPVELDGEQQAAGPAPRRRRRARSSAVGEPRAGPRGPGGHVLGLHHREHGPGGGGGQRLAAVGGGVVAGLEGGGHLGLGPAGADRHAVAERLGHRDDVGHDAEVLVREPRAGAAEAGLDLVDHEQDPALVAEPADALEVLGGGRVHAALALHRLEQDRGDRRVEGARGRRGRPRRRGGSPRAAAGTPRAWPAGRWRAAWRGCGRGTSRRRSPRRAGPGRRTSGPA